MAFSDFPQQQDVARLLQRSLERGRLAHAYLFNGPDLVELEGVARTVAKVLNCLNPPQRGPGGQPIDCCDACLNCRKVDGDNHPDVLWVRPESKLRVITIDQMRELMQTVHLKPGQSACKVAVIVAADRLNVQAANAFLKTLEEPPADSVIILLSSAPERLLETILSRCLRLQFSGESVQHRDPKLLEWLAAFVESAAVGSKSLLGRYRVLSLLLTRLTEMKDGISATLAKRSPLERFDDIDPKLKEKWEEELEAAVESEYRRERAELLLSLQWWLRDVWLATLQVGADMLTYPQLAAASQAVAQRLSPGDAMENLQHLENLQRQLNTNVQEALALEVGLLRLKL
jgi:DNA polymerase-3 subunit delta'